MPALAPQPAREEGCCADRRRKAAAAAAAGGGLVHTRTASDSPPSTTSTLQATLRADAQRAQGSVVAGRRSHLAGDVGGRRHAEEGHHAAALGRLPHAAHRRAVGDHLELLRVAQHRRGKRRVEVPAGSSTDGLASLPPDQASGCHRQRTHHGATAFTRTPWTAHSHARLRVSWFIAACNPSAAPPNERASSPASLCARRDTPRCSYSARTTARQPYLRRGIERARATGRNSNHGGDVDDGGATGL
eukprot:scaffold1789_cov375-Prasinococcus_capsulatus_cf.AAC.20